MQQSKIKRTVNGHPADPASTRDLSGIAAEEMEHIQLAIVAGIREAEGFLAMEDDPMIAVLENAQAVNEQHGIPGFDPNAMQLDDLRDYFREGLQALRSVQVKFRTATGFAARSVKGITPKEYEHLVTSVQAGVREAVVYGSIDPAEIHAGIEHLKGLYQAWGLAPWNHYDQYADRFPAFFETRMETLTAVLQQINQPYPECEYPDQTVVK